MTAGPDSEGTGRAGDGGHPDLETLAELQEGLLERADERRVRRHLASCGECTDALAGLDATRGLLAALPPVTMPDDVAARLDEALADAGPAAVSGAATVVPASTAKRSRWWSSGTFAGTAAAAAVVLLVAGVIAGALHSSNRGSNTSTSAAGSAESATVGPKTFSATASGRNYTAATLASSLPALLGKPAATGSPSGVTGLSRAAAPGGTATGSGGAPAGDSAAAPAPTTAFKTLTEPQKLLDCVAALTGQPAGSVTPLAADLASFQGKPAAVIVLPSPNRPALVDVWVVGPGCSPADQQFIYFLRAARPS